MTAQELIEKLEQLPSEKVVICVNENRGWDNIQEVNENGAVIEIVFGGGSLFSDVG